VLDWQSSVMEGPSSVWFLIIASLVRWSRGGTLPALGWVPCIPSQCRSLRSSLLCFHVALACQTGFSNLLAAQMWMLLVVMLDGASSHRSSPDAASWVHTLLLIWSRLFALVLFFFFIYLSC
jgi:hypothetical protein